MHEYKTCTKCGQTKTLENYSRHNGKKSSKSGLRATCKSCDSQAVKLYREANKDKIRETLYRWRAKNPEAIRKIAARDYQKNKPRRNAASAAYQRQNKDKVRIYTHTRRVKILDNGIFQVTEKDIRRMLQKPCLYCQVKPSEHIDHIIPVSRGGRHSIGNLTGSCASCNLSKNAKFITEWKKGKNAG